MAPESRQLNEIDDLETCSLVAASMLNVGFQKFLGSRFMKELVSILCLELQRVFNLPSLMLKPD